MCHGNNIIKALLYFAQHITIYMLQLLQHGLVRIAVALGSIESPPLSYLGNSLQRACCEK